MKNYSQKKVFSLIAMFVFMLGHTQEPTQKSEFWEKVQFGGGLGLGFGNNSTNILIAPSAIYNLSPIASLGLGLQYSYIIQKDFYTSHLYGGSIIGLVNPIQEIQLSVELEQLKVNTKYTTSLIGSNVFPKDAFWNTALFLGTGYRASNVTIGVRYNVLHNDKNNIYTTAFMPFVRVYF